MKSLKFTLIALLATFMMVGCADEQLSIGNGDKGEISSKGVLSISGLVVDCRIDELDPDENVAPKNVSRATINVDNFDCSIINEKNEVVKSFKYGARPTEDIELETGDYIFKVVSGEVPGAAWDTPVYGAEKPFKIVRNQATTLSEVICTLLQIKVTVSYAPDLLERLGRSTLTTVSVDSNSLEYSLNETRAGFFSASQASNTLVLHISGTYAADKDIENGKVIEMVKEIHDVKIGQHRKIHFYLENTAEGNINISVTIRDWVTDETIPSNVADKIAEEELVENEDNNGGDNGGNNDPGTSTEDPSIVWDGHDISQREQITGGLSVDLLVSASKGIKEFFVKIESASLTPAELAGVGLCDVLNLCYPKQSYDSNNPGVYIDVEDPLRGLGFAVGDEVVNKTFVKLSITQFMGVLQAVSGTDLKNHDFVLTVTDNEGNTTVKTLMLQTGK